MANVCKLDLGFGGLIPNVPVEMIGKISVASLRYTLDPERDPDGAGVYLRGNTKAFQNVLALNKDLIAAATTCDIEYTYEEDGKVIVAPIRVPLADVLAGFEIATELGKHHDAMKALDAKWEAIDKRVKTPKAKGAKDDKVVTPPEDQVKAAQDQMTAVLAALNAAKEAAEKAKAVDDAKAKAEAK